MEILGRYGNSGIDIEGTEESLRELSGAIEGLSGVKVLPLSGVRPPQDPYPGHAKSLRLALSDEPVCIRLTGDEISVCGASDKLKILAQNIRALADQEKQESNGRIQLHSHIEYYPGHYFLKAESIPLVVTKTERI
jgi:hypothetical protein